MSKRGIADGLTPIRVRRRQSDAKWRASVASCYDTLKFVIPNAHKLSKKKVSKALILQETERHINYLEYTLSELFNNRAANYGKTILWQEEENYHPATLQDVKSDFERKQAEIFSQSAQGRRRYHLLSDIEDQIVDMTVNFDRLAIVTRVGNMVVHSNRTVIKKGVSSTIVNSPDWDNTVYSHGLLDGQFIPMAGDTNKVEMLMIQNNEDGDVHQVPIQSTPEKCHPALYNNSDPSMAALSDDYLNSPIYISESDVMLASPKITQVTKQLNFSSSFESSGDLLEDTTPMKTASLSLGFTPVKLPSELEEDEGYSNNSNNVSNNNSRETEEDSLLCLETFDTDDSCDLQLEKTPESKISLVEASLMFDSPHKTSAKRKMHAERELPRHRRETGYVPKCRRRLDKCFVDEVSEQKENLPIINGVFDKDADCSDFDGYFLFYRQMANQLENHMSRSEIESPSVASMVSGLWNTMSKEDKNTLATLASLENNPDCSSSQSSLSDDLIELDVKPFSGAGYKDRIEDNKIKDTSLHAVPDDLDLGVSLLPDSDFYNLTTVTSDTKGYPNILTDEDRYEVIDDFQVVPDLS